LGEGRGWIGTLAIISGLSSAGCGSSTIMYLQKPLTGRKTANPDR
jgi:hypothetical protein